MKLSLQTSSNVIRNLVAIGFIQDRNGLVTNQDKLLCSDVRYDNDRKQLSTVYKLYNAERTQCAELIYYKNGGNFFHSYTC